MRHSSCLTGPGLSQRRSTRSQSYRRMLLSLSEIAATTKLAVAAAQAEGSSTQTIVRLRSGDWIAP